MKTVKSILLVGIGTISLYPGCNNQHVQETSVEKNAMAKEAFTDVVDTSIGSAITNQPEAYFYLAEEAFTHKKYKESADALKAAANKMEDLAKDADSEDGQAINNSIAELRDLASNVVFDKVDGIDELTFFTGKAFLALASYRLKATEKFILMDMVDEASNHLNLTIKNYHVANDYCGEELTALETAAIQGLEGIGWKLENGVAVDQETVEQVFADFEAALQSLKTNHYQKRNPQPEL